MQQFAEQNSHKTDIEKWMAFMKAAGDKSKRNILDKVRTESEVIDMAVNKLEVLSKDEKQRQAYYAREKALLDEKSKAAYFKKKEERAKEKAKEKAKEEGIKEGRIQSAKDALKEGLDIKLVAKISDLSIEEVVELKEQIEKEIN